MINFSFVQKLGNSTEAIDWNKPIIVIGLKNFSNRSQCSNILVTFTNKMETTGILLISIACSKVNGSRQLNFPATCQILQKRRYFNKFLFVKYKTTATFSSIEFIFIFKIFNVKFNFIAFCRG